MDSVKALQKYIRPAAWLGALCAALFLLAAGALYAGVALAKRDYTGEAVRFDPVDGAGGSYAYIDVRGVSDWVYQYDYETYYAAKDADGYLCAARLYQRQLDEMTAQRDYWESAGGAPAPAPYRVYGLVREAGTSLRESFAEVFDLADGEFELYFGSLYLDATSTPGQDAAWIYYLVALFSFLFSMLFLVLVLPQNANARRCLKRLAARGELERAAYAFASPACESGQGERVRIGGEYLFGRGSGIAVRFDDILWAYTRAVNYRCYSLAIHTAGFQNVESVYFGPGSADAQVAAILSQIARRNPNALIGYTEENKTKYKALRRAGKRADGGRETR